MMTYYNKEEDAMIPVFKKIENYKEYFKTEFGHKKYRTIESKVNNHNGIKKMIAKSQNLNIAPYGDIYIQTLLAKPFFMIAKADTLFLGAILSLEKWHYSLNQSYSLQDEYEINKVYDDMRKRTDKMRF